MIIVPDRKVSNTMWQKLFKVFDQCDWDKNQAQKLNPYKWGNKRKQWDKLCSAACSAISF